MPDENTGEKRRTQEICGMQAARVHVSAASPKYSAYNSSDRFAHSEEFDAAGGRRRQLTTATHQPELT
jgi:hypothetical protein